MNNESAPPKYNHIYNMKVMDRVKNKEKDRESDTCVCVHTEIRYKDMVLRTNKPSNISLNKHVYLIHFLNEQIKGKPRAIT